MKHGTNKAYTRGACRCDQCRVAHNDYQATVSRLQAYGKYQDQLRSPLKAINHIAKLRATGITIEQIHKLTGIATCTIGRISRGQANTITGKTERAVLALQPAHEHIADQTMLDPTGTARRLQALQYNGWTQTQIAAKLGEKAPHIWKVIHQIQGAPKHLADKVSKLYEELWDTRPAPWEQRNTLAVSTARRNGWLPALAWDEDRIDDPAHLGYPEAVAA